MMTIAVETDEQDSFVNGYLAALHMIGYRRMAPMPGIPAAKIFPWIDYDVISFSSFAPRHRLMQAFNYYQKGRVQSPSVKALFQKFFAGRGEIATHVTLAMMIAYARSVVLAHLGLSGQKFTSSQFR